MPFRCQRVVTGAGEVSYTVLGPGGVVEPAERFLCFLTAIDRSLHTVRAYGFDLAFWFEHLATKDRAWVAASLEDVASFSSWYRRGSVSGDGKVVRLDADRRSPKTVNRALAAVFSFYDFHADDAPLASRLAPYRASTTARQKLIGRHTSRPRSLRMAEPKRLVQTLSGEQVRAVVTACDRYRDRLLVSLWLLQGLRVGATLGLRHSDIDVRKRTLTVLPRANVNGARAKGGGVVPLLDVVAGLYVEYLHTEYGDLDSDFVFVNLWGEPIGAPMTYGGVRGVVERIVKRSGVDFSPHVCRHTFATDLQRNGARLEVVSSLLLHASVETTSSTYTHLSVEDLRRQLMAAQRP